MVFCWVAHKRIWHFKVCEACNWNGEHDAKRTSIFKFCEVSSAQMRSSPERKCNNKHLNKQESQQTTTRIVVITLGDQHTPPPIVIQRNFNLCASLQCWLTSSCWGFEVDGSLYPWHCHRHHIRGQNAIIMRRKASFCECLHVFFVCTRRCGCARSNGSCRCVSGSMAAFAGGSAVSLTDEILHLVHWQPMLALVTTDFESWNWQTRPILHSWGQS